MRNRLLRRHWDRQAEAWDRHVWSSDAFLEVQRVVMDAAAPQGHEVCADLGAGSGFVTWALAARAAHVAAVDISPEMGRFMLTEARAKGVENVDVIVAALQDFDMGDDALDLVVSSYALHHLTNKEKRELVYRSRRWIRPGGRLVIADMMFGRGATARDRQILASKSRQLLRKGPGGVWRLVKNVVRFGLRLGTERPASPAFWTSLLIEAGFTNVDYAPIVGEAGLIVGRVPAFAAPSPDGCSVGPLAATAHGVLLRAAVKE